VQPADFVGVAEETGLIAPLGLRTLEIACGQVADWQRRLGADLYVAVNVSAHQLTDARFATRVLDIARASGLAPGSLQVEITESALMEQSGSPLAVLERLRDGGVRVALDDFGTGYSSLAYLRRLQLDTLKLDRAFIAGLQGSRKDRAIVQAVLSMARSLGVDVVAEGVESEAQLERLKALGCPLAQGFLFAGPLPAGDAEAFLAGPVAMPRPARG
jgi:EAL domain-containing protein (putative c-di-GMP-specific phosphodiesterase class I)